MSTSAFESLDVLKIFLSKSTQDQFQEVLPLFSLTELAESLILLQTQPTLEAKSKLDHLFEFADSAITLEFLGKYFSVSSFVHFLEFLTHHTQYQNRLNFILVGLPPTVFSQALHVLHSHHLHILKHEGLLEPLQYHLTQFIHEGETLKLIIEQKAQQFKQELASIQTEDLTQESLQALNQCIDNMRNQLLDYLERASTALAIAWHTDRIDLIDKLSSINESTQHQLAYLIGHPSFDNLKATGSYAFLEQTLSNVFDSALKDEDAAIEGLTRLSLWHLKDYWEIGLLPSIQHAEELEVNPQKYNDKEHGIYQQKLISLVQKQLEYLGIGKISDLKQHHLFSPSLLRTYIEQHQHLLLKD